MANPIRVVRLGKVALALVAAILAFAPVLAAAEPEGEPMIAQRSRTAATYDRGPSSGDPGPGKFLIASRSLRDPNFAESVVLLIDYSRDGAMGVVINRPTETRLAEALPEIDSLEDRAETVWLGGPVARWQMVLLTRSDEPPESSRRVMAGVWFSASRVLLESLIEQEREFRVYAGHAGWSAGQLDGEIARGGWHVMPGDSDMVFDRSPLGVWRELIERASVKWVRRDLGTGLAEAWLFSRMAP